MVERTTISFEYAGYVLVMGRWDKKLRARIYLMCGGADKEILAALVLTLPQHDGGRDVCTEIASFLPLITDLYE